MKKHMMVLPILFLAACHKSAHTSPQAASLQQWETNFTYRGVAFGTPQEEAIKTLSPSCEVRRGFGLTACTNTIEMADTTVDETFTFDSDPSVLSRVFWGFPSNSYGGLRDTFIAKYGKPTSTNTSILHNAMGASFQQEESHWEGRDISIRLLKYGQDISKGLAAFITQEQMRQDLLKEASKREQDSKKF
jgi:hypothetical protein